LVQDTAVGAPGQEKALTAGRHRSGVGAERTSMTESAGDGE
jgi:hypothetical protein